MEKHELLKMMDEALLEALFGFCCARTNDSYEAQDLCSDIVYALMKAARSDGEIWNVHAFIWRTARNVYADYCRRRRQDAGRFYEGDAGEILAGLADRQEEEDEGELLAAVYRQISFLTKAYREIMIGFYLDGLSTAELAARHGLSQSAVRQRLFLARKEVRREVNEMKERERKPAALDSMEYQFMGMGDPAWGDPSTVCTRRFSRNIIWLCRGKAMSAAEIAEELNVPTVYVEEELEILAAGENGQYGLLREQSPGKYIINFILLDGKAMEEAQAIYLEQIPNICGVLMDFIEQNREAYLAFPYRNREPEWNLILWQQLDVMAGAFSRQVERILKEQYFADVKEVERPYSVYGYVNQKASCGSFMDGILAENLCGYSKVTAVNIYNRYIRAHFHCNGNLARDPQLQLALRAIGGLEISSLTEREKEHAARAVESGYLYRDGEMLYTRILVHDGKDAGRLFEVSRRLRDGYFDREAKAAAGRDLCRRLIVDNP